MYKIGFADIPAIKKEALKLAEKLKFNEVETHVSELNSEADNTDLEFHYNLMRNNVFDVVCVSLPAINEGLPDDVVIAALSERSDCFEKLIYNSISESQNPHIKLKDEASIAVFNNRAEVIAKDLFPQWQITVLNVDQLNRDLLDIYDGVLASCERIETSNIDENNYATFKFHPKEFIPHPGQNVIAFLCKNDDRELRKILAKVHITEVSQATNIERKIDQELSDKGWSGIGVYCLVDHNYHYHVYASGISPEDKTFRRTRYSTATSENIAKIVLDLLSAID